MSAAHGVAPDSRGTAGGVAGTLAAGAALYAALLAYSFVQSPVPGENEPQYLGKALHFFEPAYCPGDFFLDSSDPHGAFYLLTGPVAVRWGLPAAAVFGRLTGLAVLAAGWTWLARRVIGTAWAAPVSGAAFLACAAAGNLSGEWLVGGAEGKVFAYGLLLAAFAAGAGGRAILAAALAGAGASFHPVVGAWGVLCGLLAAAFIAWRARRMGEAVRLPTPRRWLLSAAAFAACAAPGFYFALGALGVGEEPPAWFEAAGGAERAHFVQVYRRLPHHLDPMTFRTPAWVGFAHLLVGWAVLRRFARRTAAEPAFAAAVCGSLLIAYAGVLVGLRGGEPHEAGLLHPYTRAFLLKFYPFRLADVLAPLAASLVLAGCAVRWTGAATVGESAVPSPPRPFARRLLVALGTAVLLALALWIPFYDRDPGGLSAGDAAAWRTVCERINEELPPDALFVTPPGAHAFGWHARRAEFVQFKDCPQDPAGILEWDRRLPIQRDWAREHYLDDARPGYDAADLAELRRRTGATHLLTGSLGPMRTAPVLRAGRWRVYELPGE